LLLDALAQVLAAMTVLGLNLAGNDAPLRAKRAPRVQTTHIADYSRVSLTA
jgi:hypothetical protein